MEMVSLSSGSLSSLEALRAASTCMLKSSAPSSRTLEEEHTYFDVVMRNLELRARELGPTNPFFVMLSTIQVIFIHRF